MRWMKMLAAAATLAACTGPISIGGAPGGGESAGGGTMSGGTSGASRSPDALIADMVRLVNAHRRARGCTELAWLEPAAAAAQSHSDDMARRNYFEHVSPEGQRPWDRLTARNVRYRLIAENIAYTPGAGARETLAGWLQSPGHRQNLDNCGYTHHGLGLREARWTHLFVTPIP